MFVYSSRRPLLMRQTKRQMQLWESVLAVLSRENCDRKSQRLLSFFQSNKPAIRDYGNMVTSNIYLVSSCALNVESRFSKTCNYGNSAFYAGLCCRLMQHFSRFLIYCSLWFLSIAERFFQK